MGQKRQPTNIQNVYRYPNGMLYYRKGKIEESLKTTNEREARERKIAIESRMMKYGFQSFKSSFAGLSPLYIKFLEEKRRAGEFSEETLKTYKRIWEKHLLPYFGSMKLSQFDEKEWITYIERHCKVNQQEGVRKLMYKFLKWARTERYLDKRISLDIEKFEGRGRRIATPAQIKTFLEHADDRLLLYTACCLLCGMRGNEIRRIEIPQIHLDEQYFEILDIKEKRGKGREVPFNNWIKALILKRLELRKKLGIKSPYLFWQRNPKKPVARSRPDKWWTELRKAKPALGDLTMHDLRATFKTHLNKKTDFTDMQKEFYAGSTMKVQKQHYVKMSADDLRGMENTIQIDGLDELFTKRIEDVTLGKTRGTKTRKSTKSLHSR